MLTVKVTFEDGSSIITCISATFEEAEQYYLGRRFNLGVAEDKLVKVIKIERV